MGFFFEPQHMQTGPYLTRTLYRNSRHARLLKKVTCCFFQFLDRFFLRLRFFFAGFLGVNALANFNIKHLSSYGLDSERIVSGPEELI